MNTRKMLFAATAAAAALMSMTQAQAVESVPQRKVNYADLNLNEPADTAKLYQRLRAAAEDVCARFEGPRRHDRHLHSQCLSDSLRAAIEDVNHKGLLALHVSQRRDVRLAGTPTDTSPRS